MIESDVSSEKVNQRKRLFNDEYGDGRRKGDKSLNEILPTI